MKGIGTYSVICQTGVSLFHSIVDLLCEICVNSASPRWWILTGRLDVRLAQVGQDKLINLGSAVREILGVVGIGFHDQMHVDLKCLELRAVVLVSVGGKVRSNLFESLSKYSALLVPLRDLLLVLWLRRVRLKSVARGLHDWGVLWRLGHSHCLAE